VSLIAVYDEKQPFFASLVGIFLVVYFQKNVYMRDPFKFYDDM
jgi:hypothetical protein